MANALPSSLPPVGPATAANSPAAPPRNGDGAGDEAATRRFSQALDQAVAAEPPPPARGHGGPSRSRANGDARDTAQGEDDPDSADDAPTLAGVGDLLAQLRASGAAAPIVDAEKLDAQGGAGESARAGRGGPGQLGTGAGPAGAAGGETAALSRTDDTRAEFGNELNAMRLAAAPSAEASTPRGEAAAAFVPAAAPGGALATAAHTSAPAEAQLAARPGSAEFGAQLGTQISTFVRAGVQHARLQLNPADLGPVSVHIKLNGQAALVHLSAEHAQTRQALEQAMPQLASSLRDAGLTLTGGGVFQQPHQDRDAAPHAHGSASGTSAAPGDPESPRGETVAAAVRPRGVVDLVA